MWGDQLELGYSADYALRIEGICHVFVERRLRRVDTDEEPALPSGWDTLTPGLLIGSQSIAGQELDREAGIARGRALDLQVSLEEIADAAGLFGAPTEEVRIRSELSGTDTAKLESDGVFSATSGRLYIGRETIDYTDTETAPGDEGFKNLVRGVCGLPYRHGASASSGYARITNRPVYWRGRFVEVWEHLVSPDERYLGTAYCEGEGARLVWRGYLDEQPTIRDGRVHFRALGLERKFAQALGSPVSGRLLRPLTAVALTHDDDFEAFPQASLYATESDKIIITEESSGDSIQLPRFAERATTVGSWAAQVCSEARIFFGGNFNVGWSATLSLSGYFVGISFYVPIGYTVQSAAWFLDPLIGEIFGSGLLRDGARVWPMGFTSIGPGAWVFVRVDNGYVGQPEVWPSAGVGLIEGSEGEELIAWDAADSSFFADTGKVAIRLSGRGLGGTTPIDFAAETGEMRISSVAGLIGLLGEVMETLATSSGTGLRGPLDTLPQGYGLGIPADWLDFGGYPMDAVEIDGLSEPGSSLADIAGGWLAMQQRCIAQVQDGATTRLKVVDWSPTDSGLIRTLADADIILGTVRHQSLMRSPTRVEVSRILIGEAPAIVVADVPRIAAEGESTVSFSAPGITEAQAVAWGTDTLRLSDGLQAVTVGVRPSFRPVLGEPLRVTASHPAFWSWQAGDFDAGLVCVVVGVERHLDTGQELLTLLLPGAAPPLLSLVPAAEVLARPSSVTLDVDLEYRGQFLPGMEVRVYNAGDDTDGWEDREVKTAVEASGRWRIDFDPAIDAGDFAAGAWLTYADHAAVTTAQKRHLYFDTDGEVFR